MTKYVVVLGTVAVLVVAAAVGYRLGWFEHIRGTPAGSARSGAVSGGLPAAGSVSSPGAVPSAGETAASPAAGQSAGAVPATQGVLPKFDGNVAALEWGGKVEAATGNAPDDDRVIQAIDGNPDTLWPPENGTGPAEIVLSFFEREPALVDAVVIVNASNPKVAARDVEVWTSMIGPADGFTKAATATLPPGEESKITFEPVEARFVKVRLLHNQGGQTEFEIVELKVMEAQRAGYTSIVARHPEMLGPLGPMAGGFSPPSASMPACVPAAAPPLQPGHGESRKVLVLTESNVDVLYDGYTLKKTDPKDRKTHSADLSIVDRAEMTAVRSYWARPWLLSDKQGYDTVVMEQICNDHGPRQLPPSFKQALPAWVAVGHKLIIHDSDKCAPTGPDYSWLPYHWATSNPGAKGAPGTFLRFIEENWMAHGRRGRQGFIDTSAWENSINGDLIAGYRNELGDSNTVIEWDPHWCGHMVVRNVNDVFGFVQAYAHYGRGLIIYSGLDVDMGDTTGYDILVARELAQGFDPDNLPCSARLGSFVLTTETPLLERALVPGRSYTYPLTILSNQGYTGIVTLALTSSPALEGLQQRLEPSSVKVAGLAESTLTLTLSANLKQPAAAVEVKGTDSAGKTNSVCLQLVPPHSGELAVVSALERPQKTRKNLQIILDASGSMKTPLGKKSRWDTALATLREVLSKLPDDFNVGLRIYGHREASRSPKTCTDSELVVPIAKLDREAILTAAKAVKPKGETPLVYSVLQAPADLKQVGGGTVILITDGEESCKGDALKAAAELKASGLDVTLNIVGFALNNPQVQKQLGGFAQATGGRFYAAQSGEALAEALLIAAIESFPYTIYDAAGKEVAAGEAGGPPEELPAGEYKVVVKAGAQELVAPRVKVTLGQATTVRIAVKNGALVLEQ